MEEWCAGTYEIDPAAAEAAFRELADLIRSRFSLPEVNGSSAVHTLVDVTNAADSIPGFEN